MSRFWKIVVIIALFLAGMLLITFLVPGVKAFATTFAAEKKLPLWLVGLASPILYALAKIKDGLAGVIGESNTEKDIREKNEAIKARIDVLEKSVAGLDAWRQQEIDQRMRKVQEYTSTIATMEGREQALDQSVGSLLQRRDALKNAIREDPGTIE